jgi:hypothetical protein
MRRATEALGLLLALAPPPAGFLFRVRRLRPEPLGGISLRRRYRPPSAPAASRNTGMLGFRLKEDLIART